MQNKTVGNAGSEPAEEGVDRETEGDGVGRMPGNELTKEDSRVQAHEEGTTHLHDHMVLQTFGPGQHFPTSDDHLAKPLEPQTATRQNSISGINTQTFPIKSNNSYLQDSVVGRPTSESPLQRRGEAPHHQSPSVGENPETELAPTDIVPDRLVEEHSDTIMDQSRGHQNDLQIRIKVEESPTPASLLKRTPQHLEFNHNTMASLGDQKHGLIYLADAEKRKRDELDTEDREAKFPKIADKAGDIGEVCKQMDSDYEPAESDQIEELERTIESVERPPN
ncbi:hypothetical protein V499_01948 [Pseudogymnoascus sp. VKM F-103]|nr:hypothetical protein V499_01948 [Pseudogymnoascus sp. VKM F-103]